MAGFDDKRSLSERDICSKYITPALEEAGWDLRSQIREEVTLTAGRVIVRGNLTRRGRKKFADYVLYYKPNIPIAIIEAKDNNHTVGDGMQQALRYAEMLEVPFVFSSNGDGFLAHDCTVISGPREVELSLRQFPSPDTLWRRYCDWIGMDDAAQRIVTQDYYVDDSGKIPRYYQLNAINRTMEAISEGQNRILLVMATGTGKTFTAFQIIWRLWKSKTKKRILFLADRNILVDQTRTNDFKPFGEAMTKITKRRIDHAYEIYLALYQGVSGSEEELNAYKQFSRGFFDLVVVDECHRGSAAENSAWREILDYFNEATHIGLTATPKETREVSNITYFGPPVYTYSLKQGIDDGFLAPYKVVRIDMDRDLQGWRPEKGKKDKHGQMIEDRIYNQRDFDRALILEKRTELVAKKVSEFLRTTGRYSKTIIFCENIDHAERMRSALVNENADMVAEDRRYVMRITGDNDIGKAELENFIHPEEPYPVIAATSKLMSTGVDAQTCKLIVLDQRINSISEFKQIIGRGTRIYEKGERPEDNKLYFTIMDFKKATDRFADPDFDGDPVVIYTPGPDDPPVPPNPPGGPDVDDPPSGPNIDDPPGGPDVGDPPPGPDAPGRGGPYVVDDVSVTVVAERVLYYDKDGKLITESLKDYTRKRLRKRFVSLNAFLRRWSEADRKMVILKELEEQGVFFKELAEDVGQDYGPFDLICHVAFDQPPLTRAERAHKVRKRDYFSRYSDKARAVLEALLEKYADEGIENIESMNVLKLQPLNEIGTPTEIVQAFGSKNDYLDAIRALQKTIYAA